MGDGARRARAERGRAASRSSRSSGPRDRASVRRRGAAVRIAERARGQLSRDQEQAATDSARELPRRAAPDLLLRADPDTARAEHHPVQQHETLPAGARVHHQVRPGARLHERHRAARGRPPPAPRGLGRERQSAVRRRRGEVDRPDAPGLRLALDSAGQLDRQRHAPRPGRQAGPGLPRVEGGLRPRHLPGRGLHEDRAHALDERRRAEPAGRDLEPHLSGLQRASRHGDERPLHVPRSGGGRPAQRDRHELAVVDPRPSGHAGRHGRTPPPGWPRHQPRGQAGRSAQVPLPVERPLLRAGGRGVVGRVDGRDPAGLARPASGRATR